MFIGEIVHDEECYVALFIFIMYVVVFFFIVLNYIILLSSVFVYLFYLK
jgi:hypothetical protein